MYQKTALLAKADYFRVKVDISAQPPTEHYQADRSHPALPSRRGQHYRLPEHPKFAGINSLK